ncbi:recombinase family protein [Vagococcus penaei]|nr:recombinase family protein [Vagococcus penaei]
MKSLYDKYIKDGKGKSIMKKIGYINNNGSDIYEKEQLNALTTYNVDNITATLDGEEIVLNDDIVLSEVIGELETGDELVVYELRSIGKSIIQLADFLEDLKTRGIKLVVLNKGEVYSGIDDTAYLEMILKIAEMEKVIIRERTTKGLQEARKNGRVGGRPKISQETIDQIRFLYNNNRYTLRQIAEECNISLGTAYKYVQER